MLQYETVTEEQRELFFNSLSSFLKDKTGKGKSLDSIFEDKLVEFSWGDFPSFGRAYLQNMLDQDIIPVIAHPERQKAFLEDRHLLKELIDMGCLSQVTATSIVGGYSERLRQASHDMMRDNLIHVIASDAHNVVERPFNFTSALDVIETEYSAEYKEYLVTNA